MQNRVLVLSSDKIPLMPCHPARARELLRKKKAAVYQKLPFTIILKHRKQGQTQQLRLKIDPGANTTGIALVGDFKRGKRCLFAALLFHRGLQIKKALEKRRHLRRARRSRKTRYRKARFQNRRRPKGWLPPSLQSRVENTICWTARFRKRAPITHLSLERNRFDTQALQNPEIKGVEYQQGELFGYEVREYLLEKWGRQCVYCKKKNVPLQVEHIVPKSRNGSNRVSNLTIACKECNQQKGSQTAKEFGFPKVEEQGKIPLRSAAYMNATRYKLYEALEKLGIEIEGSSGGRTKYNRLKQGYKKEDWIDAMCVGESGEKVFVEKEHEVLDIAATGWGSRQMCNVNKLGFPCSEPKGPSRINGFRSGDIVRALVPKGKKQGSYVGRVTVRSSGYFNIKTNSGRVEGISSRYCKLLQTLSGYSYHRRMAVSSPSKS